MCDDATEGELTEREEFIRINKAAWERLERQLGWPLPSWMTETEE